MRRGKMSDAELLAIEERRAPARAPAAASTRPTRCATVMELIGLSPMGFNGVPAMDPRKDEVAFRCGEVVMDLLQTGITSAATF